MSDSIDSPALDAEYDPDSGTYQFEFDPTECQLSTAVVLAVAAVTEADAVDLPALNDSLNPEFLNGLFAPKMDDTPREGGQVTFPFAGHEVTVDSDGVVILDPQQD